MTYALRRRIMSHASRILIVEDQYFVAIDCEQTLSSAGYEIVGLATTAKEAVDCAEREHPDLVLMDIRLASNTDGVDAAIVIYERLGIRSIFCSEHADAKVRELAQRARPLGWLDKPYSAGGLTEAVKEGLRALNAHPGPSRGTAHELELR
jgi:DNA-binding NarL/FixJ family response regulator